MSSIINWLHLTDWHVGRSAQGHLWPNLRYEFEKDVRSLIDKHGPIDLIFFTGDLVQSGERKQFHELEQNLKRLWSFLASVNSQPKFVVVPGNHDLRRPDPARAAVLALNGWQQQPEVRETFWENKSSDLRRCVEKSFEEFERWSAETCAPLVRSGRHLIPGDIATTFEKDGIRVAIIGLNTTFLQLKRGDYEGRLAVSARQLCEACEGDYIAWLEKHHISVLMTHHPPSWIGPDCTDEFAREICPPGRFNVHLSGHLHAGKTTLTSEAGSPFMLRHQGASLFGLEFFGEQKKEVRTHGYSMGQWAVEGTKVIERLWPRVAVTKQTGALELGPDPTSYLQVDQAIHRTFEAKSTTSESQLISGEAVEPATPTATPRKQSLFQGLLAAGEAEKKLKRALRFSHPAQLHHLSIRSDERQRLTDSIKDERCGCVVTDWGMGKDGFIGSVVRSEGLEEHEQFRFEDRVFQLRCDTFEHVSDIELAFRPQFGVSLSDFLQCVASTGPSCLILDGIQASLVEPAQRSHLTNLLDLLLDYVPTLSVVVVSRTIIPWHVAPVELHPLDLPDLRAYVQNHPNSQPEFSTGDVLERFFDASGGLPVHVDRMLERLRVASFDAVLEEESALAELAAIEAPLHKALQQAIEAVRRRDEQDGSRAIPLLKTLSILVYGETIEQLKHFLPGSAFYPRDAETLHSAALIEAIPLNVTAPVISTRNKPGAVGTVGPKVLRVPKQVRDSVLAALSSDDKKELLSAAGEFYFGHGWRVGKKPKLRKMRPEYRDYLAHGVGNEYAVLQLMIAHAKDASDEINLKAAARLGLHYCGILRGADRNRDLRLAAQGLLRQLEGTTLTNEISELNRLCGRACRLTGHDDEAVVHFQASLDHSQGHLKNEARKYALLEMTDSLRNTGNVDAALETARQVEALAQKGSLLESQVKSKLLRFEQKSDQTGKLTALKNEARSKGWVSHANDLTLALAFDTSDVDKKFSLFDEVLATDEQGWNRYRAAVEKGLLCARQKDFKQLSSRDRRDLLLAYSYCHTQRLGMFDRCHEALWELLEAEGDRDGLYRLFQHSSFFWRVRGDDSMELRYFERLNNLAAANEISGSEAALLEVRYFLKRATVLLARLLPGADGRSA